MVRRQFKDNRSFAGAVKSQMNPKRACNGGQYIVFSPVSEEQLTKIERLRDASYKQLRFMYLIDKQALIVKMLGETHELAASQFTRFLWRKAASVRPGLDDELVDIRTTTFTGRLHKKEGDSAYKPLSTRAKKGSWPTLVLEVGVSEKIGKLQLDAKWWLENSSTQVNTVLVFAITEETQVILIEQWEMVSAASPAGTRSGNFDIPTRITFFQIPPADPPQLPTDPSQPSQSAGDSSPPPANSSPPPADSSQPPTNSFPSPADSSKSPVDSSPPPADSSQASEASEDPEATEAIRLNFKKLFDREPTKGSTEGDLVFTISEFTAWARAVWGATQ